MSRHFPVVVIGAGQAGLATSFCLKQAGVDHVVLEKSRIGHSWRAERWDSFCLVTPNWQCRLPGFPYAGDDPDGFMLKDEIVKYVDDYAASFGPPVEEGVEVQAVRPTAAGYLVVTSREDLTAEHVVVATGGYHTPVVPPADLPESVTPFHSSNYRSPAALPPGEVLVVGSGQSGCQIAEDLHLAGRKVHLAVGSAPRCARFYRGADVVKWLDLMGHYDLPVDRMPDPDRTRDKTNHYVTGRDGGRDIDLRRFALQGMKLYGPLRGVEAGIAEFGDELEAHLDAADDVYRSINRSIDAYVAKEGIAAPPGSEYVAPWRPGVPVLELDLVKAGVSAVVWCIGFRTEFGWIDAPIFDEQGRVKHHRGVTAAPGLYFVGLPWLHTWGSGRFSGVGRDADHVVGKIVETRASRRRTA